METGSEAPHDYYGVLLSKDVALVRNAAFGDFDWLVCLKINGIWFSTGSKTQGINQNITKTAEFTGWSPKKVEGHLKRQAAQAAYWDEQDAKQAKQEREKKARRERIQREDAAS